MTIIKSFSVGNGDTTYIEHNSNNFTIIDCCLTEETKNEIVNEIKQKSAHRITRFISTHPDEDHIKGIEFLDEEINILNFYVVNNKAIKKDSESTSFRHYCHLRDDNEKAFNIYQGCTRKWMNQGDETRDGSGINILWPKLENNHFKQALQDVSKGDNFNNISPVIRYCMENGASVLWLGDLETQFMENIFDDIKNKLQKTTIIFAPHHGRDSGKIPNEWLEILDPQIIIIGEAPCRHLNYYTGYKTITQNRAGDITILLDNDKVHFYSSNESYKPTKALNEYYDQKKDSSLGYYFGSLIVETKYTL